MQLFVFYEHVLHGGKHSLHTLFKGIVVAGQLVWHEYPNKFFVLHDVQFVWVIEHVAQSSWQSCATPLIFTYPFGVTSKHWPLK